MIEKHDFRRVLGSFAAGVTVVTTRGTDGTAYGLTATAFTSVSLNPPLVLVCVDKRSESHPHLPKSKIFAVNLLAADQEELSGRFATSGTDKFAGLETTTAVTGAPILKGALGYVDCRTTQIVDAGDHTIFIGEIQALDAVEGAPLLYFRGAYHSLPRAS
jgi:flavin reductase (DIM6/NTAB) family NADH-FMN oxidoreductase RutF